MAGTFILSLDCEGKWGMADHLTADHHRWLTPTRLREAYQRLLHLLAEHRVEATFAFVMAFLLTDREQRDRNALFQDQPIGGRNWLHNFRVAQAEENMDGWTMPELLDVVAADGAHEIGCHGFSHLPLAPTVVSREVMAREVAAASSVAAEKDLALRTFVYPRNLVGYPDQLAREGYAGFRDRLPVRDGRVGQVGNLLSEFDVTQRPQSDASGTGTPIAIPSGFFFNWRLGARARVPRSITVLRWRRMLERAARDGGVVHLWLHPHNIISAPGTFDVLREVIRDVARLRDGGCLEVRTQARYCAERTPR